MKTLLLILYPVILLTVAIGCFVGGVVYADKTSRIPKDGDFEIEGYFTDIQRTELTIVDGAYPYFTNGTGASAEEAEDYKNHPENYAAYEAKLVFTNLSNYEIYPVWAVLPGYQAGYEKVTLKPGRSDPDRKVWLECWLSEGALGLPAGYPYETQLRFIVKKDGLSDQELQDLIENVQVNLSVGICVESLHAQYDISRNIIFDCPLYYKEDPGIVTGTD